MLRINSVGVALVCSGVQQLILLANGHQTVVDLNPRAVIFRVGLTFAVFLAAAGTIHQAFGTFGNGANLTPGNNESAGKKKSVRITRAGVYLKPALVQVAHAAVKSNKSPYYKAKYERIMKRRGKKRAIIAVARMILTAVYHMLSTGEAWNPTDLYKIDMPEPLKNKQKEKAVKQAMKLLIAEGIIKEPLLAS